MNNLLKKVENAVSYHTKSSISKYDVLLGDDKLLKLIINNIGKKYEYDVLHKQVIGLIDQGLSTVQVQDFEYTQTEPTFNETVDDNINKAIYQVLNQIENEFVRMELIRIALAPKKMFRAKMFLKINENESYEYAALIELFHLATLIQDDVIDMATTRRHIQTINSLYDDRTAILISDYLLVHIGAMIGQFGRSHESEVKAVDKSVQNYYQDLVKDFLKSLLYSEREVTSVKDLASYEKYASDKTAKFFAIALISGELTSDRQQTVESLKKVGQFGLDFGLYFQKIDDLLDYIGDIEISGKDSRDIENNVNNYVLLSLESMDITQIKQILVNDGNKLLTSEFGDMYATEINYLLKRVND